MSDGSIKIDTKIDQAGVKKGLNEINKNVRDTMGKLATFGKASLGVMAAAVGAVAAATGKWLKEADRIDKVSQQIGVTKKTFQELDYVMKQNGASIDAFAMGAKTLQQNMVSNSQAFKTLGVEIRNTDGSLRSQDDVMKDVIRKFEKMEQGVEKSALAQDLFGRSAQDLMPMLNNQAGGMDELIKKAHDMGAVMGDDAVAAAVVLGDTITDLQVSISTLLNTVIAPFVPALQKVAEWMSNLSGSVSGTIGMHTNLGKETNTLITATNNYKTAVQNLDSAQKDITDTERTLLKGRKELARLALEKALAETSKGYAKTTEQVAKLKKEEADRIAAVGRYSSLMKQLEVIANGPADAARAASEALGISITSARESYGKAARSFEAENMKLIETQTKLTAVSTEQAEAIAEIARAVNDGSLNIDIYRTTNRALYNDIMASAEAQKLLNETIEDAPAAGGGGVAGALEDIDALKAAQEEYEKDIGARKAAQEEYEKAIDITNAKANAGLITQEENTNNVNSAAQRYVDTLLSLGYRFGDMTTIGGQALEQLREGLKLTTEETQELSEEEEALAAIRKKTGKEAAIFSDKVLAGLMTEEEEREALVGLYESQIDALYQMGATSDGSDEKSAALREYIKTMNRLKDVSEKGLRGVLLAIRDKVSGIVNQVKVMMWKISKVVGSGFSFVKGVFSKGFSLLSKLAKFDPNAMLASLQEFLSGLENFFTVDLALSPVWLKSAFEMIRSFLSGITQNLPAIMKTFDNAIDSLVKLIIDYGPEFIKSAGKIIISFVKGIAKAAPQLIEVGFFILLKLMEGLAGSSDTISQTIVEVIGFLAGALIANADDIIKLGLAIVAGIIVGVFQAMPSLAKSILDGFIDLFTEADLASGVIIVLAAAIAGYTIAVNAAAIATGVMTTATNIATAAQTAFNVAMNANPIGLVVAGIAALVAGITLLIVKWKEVTEAVGGFFSAIKDVGMNLINGLIDGIKPAASGIWNVIKPIFTGIIDAIRVVFSAIKDVGKNLINGLINGIKAAASGIWNGIKSVFTGIIDAIKGFFGIHSPSTVFASLGGDMIQGLINGILSAGALIWNAVKGIFTGLWDNIKNVFSGAWDLGKSVVSAVGGGIKGVASGAWDLAKSAGSAIVSGAKSAGSAIVSGVKSAGSAVASGAKAVASGAGKVLKKLKFWDVGSPNISADHLAMVHKGERIVPKTFNQDIMSGNTMMLAPEALSSIMASFTGLGKQSVNISGVVPVVINDREIGRAAFEWLDVAAGGAYGY